MCVLIVKKQGVNMPTQKILNACADANPHGFGIATPDSLFKTLDKKEFLKQAQKISIDTPAIIHCRLATHGSIKIENCHPFVSENWVFAHNGVLDIKPENDKTDSETAFLQIFMPLIKATSINNPNVRRVISMTKGLYSKFAFMNKETQKIYIFGEFCNINEVLYSNTRWRDKMPKKQVTPPLFTYRTETYYKTLFGV